MASYLKLLLVNSFAILFLYLPIVLGETGCPEPEDIVPCICTDDPSTRLSCSHITRIETIKNISTNAERYNFQEVYIRSSILVYIPHEIFDNIVVGELYIMSTTLTSLFDRPPKSNAFYKLHIEDSTTQRGGYFDSGVHSGLLKNVTSLRTLSVQHSRLNRISSDFSTKVPSSLRQITFNNTEIRRIFPGALDELENLDKFAVESSKLSNLTRHIFPRPFNVRFLYFDHNDITSIPEDLFTDMPNLQFLTMRYNRLSVLPEAAFGGRSLNVPYIGLEGNPLKCNCLLVWLIKDKPEVIGGSCTSPSRLQGKQLQNLLPGDFNC